MKKRGAALTLEMVIILILLVIALYVAVRFFLAGTEGPRENIKEVQESLRPGIKGFIGIFNKTGVQAAGSGGQSLRRPDTEADDMERLLIQSANGDYAAKDYGNATVKLKQVIDNQDSLKYDWKAYDLLGDIHKKQNNMSNAFNSYAKAYGGASLLNEQESIYRKMLGILVSLPEQREILLEQVSPELKVSLEGGIKEYHPDEYKGYKVGSLVVSLTTNYIGIITNFDKTNNEVYLEILEQGNSNFLKGWPHNFNIAELDHTERIKTSTFAKGESIRGLLILDVFYYTKTGEFRYALDDGKIYTQAQLSDLNAGL